MPEIVVTLCHPQTGLSESLPVGSDMTIAELAEFGRGLLNLAAGTLVVTKDGKLLSGSSTLDSAGVANGDLLVVMPRPTMAAPRPAPAAPAPSQGLDFSSLLANPSTSGSGSNTNSSAGGLNFGDLLAAARSSSNNNDNPTPVYWDNMTLADAVDSNPHPKTIVTLLQTHEHLFKELNYHNPVLARKLQGQPYEKAVELWRTDMVQGSIRTAAAVTKQFHTDNDMKRRIAQNPNDPQAKTYFESRKKKMLVHQQYQQAMQEYPESMGRVLMLYVQTSINGHPIQAFVDSGAQTTIMSKKCAQACGILDYLDARFAGVAVGVGTGKILGRIHIVQMQIENTYFPCSATVMDDATLPAANTNMLLTEEEQKKVPKPKEMEFLLGLDMLKRHLCSIDLERSVLKFRLPGNGNYLTTPFLHEKDLDESKGGTKGFDADKANRELEEAQQKYYDERTKKGGENDGDDGDTDMIG